LSRNLPYGAFREATHGFIGIREKFGELYLFEEFHHDTGAPFGTVHPLKDIGSLLKDIELRTTNPTECEKCGKPCIYNQELREAWVAQGLKFEDWPRSPWECEGGCEDPSPIARTYAPLFEYLLDVDPYMAQCQKCEEVVSFCVPWDSDEGYWTHIGQWHRGRMESAADHEPILSPLKIEAFAAAQAKEEGT
jgi:hypothetical protein